MTINFDKTYCASPDCVGACNRKLPDNVPQELLNSIWFGYFCGSIFSDNKKEKIENNEKKINSIVIDSDIRGESIIIDSDIRYCASPNCVNACGLKLPIEVGKIPFELLLRMRVGYYCGSMFSENETEKPKTTLPNQ